MALRELMTDAGRFYMNEAGIVLPSITTVLGNTGDKTALLRWKERDPEKAEKIGADARERGTKLHAFAEDYFNGKRVATDIPSSDPHSLFYHKLQDYLRKHVESPIMMETGLHSPRLRVAGRTDLVAKVRDVGTAVVDYKGTTQHPKIDKYLEDYHLQVEAYSLMLMEQHGLKIDMNIVLIINGLFVQTSKKRPGDYIKPLFSRIKSFYADCSHLIPGPGEFEGGSDVVTHQCASC